MKPSVGEFVTALEAVGYEFWLQRNGPFIWLPVPQTQEAAQARRAVDAHFPLGMFEPGELHDFLRHREEQ